jgi:hypothetical protein
MFQGNTPLFTAESVNELQKLLNLLSTMLKAQLLNTPVVTVQLSLSLCSGLRDSVETYLTERSAAFSLHSNE